VWIIWYLLAIALLAMIISEARTWRGTSGDVETPDSGGLLTTKEDAHGS
jgi:hypothetical protein